MSRHTVTDKSIDDTGERMIPAYHKGRIVYGEHIVRYQAAVGLVKGRTVLDIASGSGYGTACLAASAKKIYGVDVDEEAIKYAKMNYNNSNTHFIKGDGIKIPLDDNSVDVVISFETIEHIEDYGFFMKEIKRVLTPDGLLVLSTPNDTEFPEGAHYHIHEFEHDELKKLVAKHYKNVEEYFQVTWLYNALMKNKEINSEWHQNISTINTAPVNANKAIYFYMLCSNRDIKENIEPLAAISEHWSERSILEHNKEMDKYIKDTIGHFEGILLEKDKQIKAHIHTNDMIVKELDMIKNNRVPQKLIRKVKKLLGN